jgi:hypothetical protein
MMASTVADNVSTNVSPLAANSSRNRRRLRARAPMIASAYRYRCPRARAGARGFQRRSLCPRPRRAPRASRSAARPRRSRPLRCRSGRPGIALPSRGIAPEGGSLFVRAALAAFSRIERAAPRPSRAAICRRRRAARKGAALIPGAMAAASHFPPPGQEPRLCIAKQNARTSAILRVAAAPWVRRFSVSGRAIAVKAAMGAAEFPPAERHPP